MISAAAANSACTAAKVRLIRALQDETAARRWTEAPNVHGRELAQLILARPYRRM
jgi:hypothetical protein